MSDVRTPNDSGQNPHPVSASVLDPSVEDGLPTPEPPFAVCSDGRVLMSTEAFGDRDIGQREVWAGVFLSASDVAFVMARAADAAEETAAHLAGRYPRKPKQGSGDDKDTADSENGDKE